MIHDPEFQVKSVRDADKAAREMAACYARVFLGTEDGRRVLADLRTKFGAHRPCFQKNEHGRYDYLAAALTDGERRVLREIDNALELGAPNQGLSNKTP